MSALPADIAAGTRPAKIILRSDAAIQSRYPNARDGLPSPAPGYFDAEADATAALNQRAALIGVERRRFAVDVAELVWPDPETGMPSYRLIDSEQLIDAVTLTARIEIDLEAETTTLELFG